METLYILDAKKNLREWSIKLETEGDRVFIIRKYGHVGGKLIEKRKEITQAKSKKTLKDQALFEANKEWKDQIQKKKYSINKPDDNTPAIFKPMLAQTFNPKKGFKLPCMAQPKVDGVRAYILIDDENKCTINSRNHKPWLNMDFITELFAKYKNIVFDGELYNHNMSFQQLMKLVKLKTITEKNELLKKIQNNVEYHIFDCHFTNDKDMSFEDRYNFLLSIEKDFKDTPIKFIKSTTIKTKEDIDILHDKYVKEGYEGIILRDPKSPYEYKRSKFLQKFKKFFDYEFEVIGYDKEMQNDIPLVVWKCKTSVEEKSFKKLYNEMKEQLNYKNIELTNKEFNVRPRGTNEFRAILYKEADKYIGKKLTVIFQELTDDGIPRFPVGKNFRDDI